uniref:BRCT domain-containing protein n=1 Tax=Plectus sambesii TaxID=2011161 RepID=A0A914W0C1_9BILA
ASDKLDVLLTDASCRVEVLNEAKALNAIAVSSEWLIQAIIMGECPTVDGHERYRYDYTEQIGD